MEERAYGEITSALNTDSRQDVYSKLRNGDEKISISTTHKIETPV